MEENLKECFLDPFLPLVTRDLTNSQLLVIVVQSLEVEQNDPPVCSTPDPGLKANLSLRNWAENMESQYM